MKIEDFCHPVYDKIDWNWVFDRPLTILYYECDKRSNVTDFQITSTSLPDSVTNVHSYEILYLWANQFTNDLGKVLFVDLAKMAKECGK